MDARAPSPFPDSGPSTRPAAPAGSVPPGLRAGFVVAGKYELLRRIGTGAMGEVWAARHVTLDEEVAIKLVMRGVDHEDGTSAQSRFLLEARVAASLSRKTRHIVAVTDHGEDGELGYLVMELLTGESLDHRIARTGPLPIAKVVPVISQIARGLAAAHAEGVTHRDLKPSNVFVSIDEEGKALVKLLDFGIAKLRRTMDRKAAHITQRGFLLGTPAYMSPEQARGKPTDHRTDVWALAVLSYHMLTGEFPFDGESGVELFARIIRVEPISIRELRPELPPITDDFFARAFAQRIEDRFQSATALAGAFEQLEPLAQRLLSLPPPARLVLVDDDVPSDDGELRSGVTTKGDTEPSLIVAGVPRKQRLKPRVFAGLLLIVVFAITGELLAVYFERDAPRPIGGTPAATETTPKMVAREIPAPEPAASQPEPAVMTTGELPSVAPHTPTRVRGPNVAASEEAVSPPPQPKQNADKSEIF